MARQDTVDNANGAGGGPGGRSAPNLGFARTSFLDGVNAAYLEALEKSYARDPASLDQSWREFFSQLRDESEALAAPVQRPRWRQRTRPDGDADELVSALDGNWRETRTAIGAKLEAKAKEGGLYSSAELLRATRDSVRALMMIRAYRMRGHYHANLDPLGIEPPKDHEELHPASAKRTMTVKSFSTACWGSSSRLFPRC
jgi:2-oxoglutarate dehydrogenase E1 component